MSQEKQYCEIAKKIAGGPQEILMLWNFSLPSHLFLIPLQARKTWILEREISLLALVCMPPIVCTDVF